MAGIMFPWNYREEILRKERGWLALGNKFIVPIPEVEVV